MASAFLLKKTYNAPGKGTVLVGTVLDEPICLGMRAKLGEVEIKIIKLTLGWVSGIPPGGEVYLSKIVKGDTAAVLIEVKGKIHEATKKKNFFQRILSSNESDFFN